MGGDAKLVRLVERQAGVLGQIAVDLYLTSETDYTKTSPERKLLDATAGQLDAIAEGLRTALRDRDDGRIKKFAIAAGSAVGAITIGFASGAGDGLVSSEFAQSCQAVAETTSELVDELERLEHSERWPDGQASVENVYQVGGTRTWTTGTLNNIYNG